MACLSPVFLKTEQGHTFVLCGKCPFCLQRRRNEWAFRLNEETKVSSNINFITLTYADDQLPTNENGKYSLCKEHLQGFFKRLRKCQSDYENKYNLEKRYIKYYACGEYGSKTKRPHYHFIGFNINSGILNQIEKLWGFGMVRVEHSNHQTIMYVTKYVFNENGDDYKGFALMSKNLGISYLENNTNYHKATKNFHSRSGGAYTPLPRYYRDKIFSKHDKLLNAKKTEMIMQQVYQKEVERLKPLHSQPHEYLANKVISDAQKIINNTKKNQKL